MHRICKVAVRRCNDRRCHERLCLSVRHLTWIAIVFLGGLPFAADTYAAIGVTGTPRPVTAVITAYFEERGLDCSVTNAATQQAILDTTRQALDALGYYAADLRFTHTEPGECQVDIALGKLAVIQNWQMEYVARSQEDGPLSETRKLLPSANSAFDPQAYSAIKGRVITNLTDAGYLDAKFVQTDVDIDIDTNTANVIWRVDAGTRYTVEPLVVEQSLLSPRLMKKFLDLAEGDFLINTNVLSTYDNLISSDYFSQVKVQPLNAQRVDGKIPVSITAKAAEQWSYLAGPGFATDTGPRLRAEANARYLNSEGHRLGFSSLVSPVTGNIKGEYRWPYGDPNHEWYTLDARFNYEDTDTAKSNTSALGLKRTLRLSRRWTQTTYVDLSVEEFDVSSQEGRSQLLLLGSNFTYTSTISAARPRWGQRLSIDLRAGGRLLYSDNDVVQARISAKQILPFAWGTRLLLRGEIGYSWQEDFADLPASLRFFVGGDKSVRGYALESLGSVDATNRVIGGDRLYVGSVEIDAPVRENWSVALFTDVGSAYLGSPNFSQSVGIGVRWYSPLGPIRLDLAHPMQDSDQTVRLHISLGPDI